MHSTNTSRTAARACRILLAVTALVLGLSVVLVSCRGKSREAERPDYRPARNEFSVMTYNLWGYTFEDRDGDGQRNDPKPRQEREAVIELIAANDPDVLAVQEIGVPAVFEEFHHALKDAGLSYEHIEYLDRGRAEKYLAVLSKYPLVERRPHTDDRYSIGEAEVPVARGFIDVDIQVTPGYTFRLFVAHLKSKVFHPLGQTEMRRNEARLLGKHVRNALKEDPGLNLLVVGDMNDAIRSAALREVVGKRKALLVDLRPLDYVGDAWTYFADSDDTYSRIDYMLASPGMFNELVREKTRVVRDPRTYVASDHRPLVAVFKKRDLDAAP